MKSFLIEVIHSLIRDFTLSFIKLYLNIFPGALSGRKRSSLDETMLEVIKTISPDNQKRLRNHLENFVKPHLRPDPSSYAKGRQSCWLEAEWLLNKKKFIKALPFDEKLFRYLTSQNIDFDLALVTYGKVGINWHRDDSYANFTAYSINLSTRPYEWGYQCQYPGYEWSKNRNETAPQITYTLQPGSIVKFNCKNPHAALGNDPERWSINLWTVHPKYKRQFEEVVIDF